jgi:hypothetical protein
MTKPNGIRVTALLAADADLEAGIGGATEFDAHLHQDAHALDINRFERVVMQYSGVGIKRQKFVFCIFARERINSLGQVIRAKREKFGQFSKVARPGTGPDGFDHAAKLERKRHAIAGFNLLPDTINADAYSLEFLNSDDLRHHDFGIHRYARFQALRGGFQYGPNLHVVDFRVGNPQSHTSVSQHGVHFVQFADLAQHLLLAGNDAVDLVLVDIATGGLSEAWQVECGNRGTATLDGETVFFKSLNFILQSVLAGKELVHGWIQ